MSQRNALYPAGGSRQEVPAGVINAIHPTVYVHTKQLLFEEYCT